MKNEDALLWGALKIYEVEKQNLGSKLGHLFTFPIYSFWEHGILGCRLQLVTLDGEG